MPKRKEMSNEKLRAIMSGLLTDAEDYSAEIGEMREKTTKAYNGDKYGNEMVDRSQIVTREVRDAVEVAKPLIMRVLFGSHSLVEYAANRPDHVGHARDATAFAKHVVYNENAGYIEFLSAVEDALLRKTGAFKLWYEEDETPVQTRHTGLTGMDLEVLAADEDVREVEAEPNGDYYAPHVPGGDLMAEGGEPPEPEPLFDAVVTRIESRGRLCFQALPPEEFLVSRNARSTAGARLVAHRRNITRSELIQLGYDADLVYSLSGVDTDPELEEEARSVGTTTDPESEDVSDESQVEVAYAECWVRVDFDGDGIAELRKVCVAGQGWQVLRNELADYVPIAAICPSPVAHQVIGRSLGELVEDIQRIKSMVMRNTMDSLAGAIHPDIEAVEDHVNMDDLLNTELGRIIRVRQPGMLNYKMAPFVGREVLPIVQYLDMMAESRTGLNQAAEGLNADALQSTSTAAIENAARSANSRIEFIARTFIETGIKDFFKILLRLAVENIDRPKWVRLNGRFLEVDPRSWNTDLDVSPDVALGIGSIAERLMTLRELAAKQEQILLQAGPDNPICGMVEYRNTLAEIAKLSGIVDVERYLKDPTDPANQPEPQPPEPSPELILAQAEAQRVQQDGMLKLKELELKVWEAMQKDDRERDRIMADVLLRAEKMRQDGKTVDIASIRAEVERERESHTHMHNMIQDLLAFRQQQQQPPAGPDMGSAGGM